MVEGIRLVREGTTIRKQIAARKQNLIHQLEDDPTQNRHRPTTLVKDSKGLRLKDKRRDKVKHRAAARIKAAVRARVVVKEKTAAREKVRSRSPTLSTKLARLPGGRTLSYRHNPLSGGVLISKWPY